MELSAKIEWEILGLPGEDRHVFLKEYGIEQPAIAQLSRMLYEALGLISFFTVGEDEVKAWSIPQGTSAKNAAGAIHSDIQKGFIRAEVISCEDFKETGSTSAARAKAFTGWKARTTLSKTVILLRLGSRNKARKSTCLYDFPFIVKFYSLAQHGRQEQNLACACLIAHSRSLSLRSLPLAMNLAVMRVNTRGILGPISVQLH